MGRFRRRFKRKGTWLPPRGSFFSTLNSTVGQQNNYIQFVNDNVTVSPNATPTNIFALPLLVDSPDPTLGENATAFSDYQTQTLAAEQSFGYLLNRIVGSLHIAVAPTVITENVKTPAVVAVTAGLMVRRVDEESPGSAAVGAVGTDPASLENIQDPWLWRRLWLLSPLGASTFSTDDLARPFANGVYNASNDFGTGAYNNCSVDVKSKRRVTKELRLFLDFTIRTIGWVPGVPSGDLGQVSFMGVFDYRCYGSIIPTQGNRRNATR